jgi:hypothetical protein
MGVAFINDRPASPPTRRRSKGDHRKPNIERTQPQSPGGACHRESLPRASEAGLPIGVQIARPHLEVVDWILWFAAPIGAPLHQSLDPTPQQLWENHKIGKRKRSQCDGLNAHTIELLE